MMKKSLLILTLSIFVLSCSSDDNNTSIPPSNGQFTLTLDNKINKNTELVLGETEIQNTTEESYRISLLKYIISNVQLVDSDNNVFSYPVEDSYFIINEARCATIKIPTGRLRKLCSKFRRGRHDMDLVSGLYIF